MRVENSKGECNFGQHEINFRYDDALADRRRRTPSTRTAPRRSPRRRAWRSPSWRSSTSARATRATSTARSRTRTAATSSPTDETLFDRFVAGQLACLRELTLFFAPHVNSYKRFAHGSFAPTAVAWGHDNRTCSMRVVGHGQGLRVENRLPGRRRQPLPGARRDDRRRPARHRQRARARAAPSRATPTSPTSRACRTTCTTRATCSRRSEVAREAFGQEVVDHYLNRARRRARRVRGGGHRLGAVPGLRAAVSAAYAGDRHLRGGRARCRWGAWEATLRRCSPRTYSTAVQAAGGARAAAAARRRGGRGARRAARPLDALLLAGGADVDPGTLRRRAARRDARAPGPSATASSSRWPAGRSSATCRCSASAAACSC